MPAAVRMPAEVRMPACHGRRFKGERPIGAATGEQSQPPRPCASPSPPSRHRALRVGSQVEALASELTSPKSEAIQAVYIELIEAMFAALEYHADKDRGSKVAPFFLFKNYAYFCYRCDSFMPAYASEGPLTLDLGTDAFSRDGSGSASSALSVPVVALEREGTTDLSEGPPTAPSSAQPTHGRTASSCSSLSASSGKGLNSSRGLSLSRASGGSPLESWGGGGGGTSRRIQHSPGTPTAGLRERGNDTSRSTGRSGRQNAATRRNMRRDERVTVQGPVNKQQPDGMSHRGGGGGFPLIFIPAAPPPPHPRDELWRQRRRNICLALKMVNPPPNYRANDDFSEPPRRPHSKISFSFFAEFRVRVTPGARRPVSVGVLGGGGGVS